MKIEILDHGYATLIESWGSDRGIIEAARMSTAKGFLGWGPIHLADCDLKKPFQINDPRECTCATKPGDERLLAYLWKNKHATPFEMAGLTIEVQAPILVFRQWHRHRTQSYNEMSARYTPLPDVNYVPTVERLMASSSKNRQAGTAKGAEAMTESVARCYIRDLKQAYEEQEVLYQQALCHGVPKELARAHIGVGRYSRMRASANLRNWLAFLTLRLDPHAQYEIRVYAEAVGRFIADRFPRTWGLFNGS